MLETSSGDLKVCESRDSIEAIFKVLEQGRRSSKILGSSFLAVYS